MTSVTSIGGRVVHHFHGSYWCEVVLLFRELSESLDAAIQVRREGYRLVRTDNPLIVRFEADQEGLDLFVARHPATIERCDHPACDPARDARGRKRRAPKGKPHATSWACKAESIDAIVHSIDHGPAFTVRIETDAPHEQMSFHGVWLRSLGEVQS